MTVMNNKQPSVLKIVIKSTVLVFILSMMILLMVFTVQYAAGTYDISMSMAEKMDMCEECYRDKNYSKMRDSMQLFDAYEESFDVYWEAVNGYADYMQYLQWSNTAEEDVEGSEEMAEYYREKIIKNAENCKFSGNKKQLEEYANVINK